MISFILNVGDTMKKTYLFVGLIVFTIVMGVILFFFMNSTVNEEAIYTDVLVTDPAVTTLYDMVNPSDDVVSLYDLYQREVFTNEYILGCAIVMYYKDHPNTNGEISSNDVSLYVKRIFGDIAYENSSGFVANSLVSSFSYDTNSDTYHCALAGGGSNTESIERKIVLAKKSDTEYIITEKSIVIYEDNLGKEEEKYSLSIYDDVSHTNLLDTISFSGNVRPSISIQDYMDQASTYEYHFEFNGENFVFRSFKKVR